MAVESDSTRSVEASVSADLAIHSSIAATIPEYFEAIPHGGALPALPSISINMYLGDGPKRALIEQLAQVVRGAYGAQRPALAAE